MTVSANKIVLKVTYDEKFDAESSERTKGKDRFKYKIIGKRKRRYEYGTVMGYNVFICVMQYITSATKKKLLMRDEIL